MSAFQKIIGRDDAGNPVRSDTWMFKFKFAGKQHTGFGYATKGTAEEAERAARAAIKAGKTVEVKALLNPRTIQKLTLADIQPHYLAAPPAPRRASGHARECNLRRLHDLLRTAGCADPDAVSLGELTPGLIYRYRNAVEIRAAGEDESRRLQIFRSANSTLRQARSVFSRDFLEYYREVARLSLTDISGFLKAPAFKGCRKDEYAPPNDVTVAKTFSALLDMECRDLNLFKACWLALGFGLRASEIAEARNGWFTVVEGSVYVAGDKLGKNKRFPRVRCQLEAWLQLFPYIEGRPGADYVLHGTPTERHDDVFRRISCWMRGLGWQTQHHVHELRAFAGCQVAMHSERGLLDAQTFLRHASVTTTEAAYSHHMKRHLSAVPLQLPGIASFEPKLVHA